jgi:hypothetical protein
MARKRAYNKLSKTVLSLRRLGMLLQLKIISLGHNNLKDLESTRLIKNHTKIININLWVQPKQSTTAAQGKSGSTIPHLTTIINQQEKTTDISLRLLHSVFKSKEIKSSSILITIKEEVVDLSLQLGQGTKNIEPS